MNKNPYDFVRTDWTNKPDRKRPDWYDCFHGLSGSIECKLTIKTPLFIPHAKAALKHLFYYRTTRDYRKIYLIPGSSLKGMLRNLVETIGNGCYSRFDGFYENKSRGKNINLKSCLPDDFDPCKYLNALCVGCRMFGFMGKAHTVYKGKVSVSDAESQGEITEKMFEHFKLGAMGGPSPWHTPFYLDKNGNRILGRKFYYHHANAHNAVNRATVEKQALSSGEFSFTVTFHNLDEMDLSLLLYAIRLEEGMWHKIGYGKPQGLGSVGIGILRISFQDMEKRYSGKENSLQVLTGDALSGFLTKKMDTFISQHRSPEVLADLRRIWSNQGLDEVQYAYPDQNWFRENGNVHLVDYQKGVRK